MIRPLPRHTHGSAQLRRGPNQDNIVFTLLNHPNYDKALTFQGIPPGSAQLRRGPIQDNIGFATYSFTLLNHPSYDKTLAKA